MQTEMYRFHVDRRKRRFSNTMTSCLGTGLTLPHIGFEMLRVDADFFKHEGKSYVFENTRLRVDSQIRFENPTCGRRFFKLNVLENTRLRGSRARCQTNEEAACVFHTPYALLVLYHQFLFCCGFSTVANYVFPHFDYM